MEKRPSLSLYNKRSTMERTAILQTDYLDILYSHRNKTYGGYELRKHYSNRAVKATFATMAAIVLLIAANAIAGKLKGHEIIAPPPLTITKLTEINIEPVRPKIELPPAAPPPAAMPTVKLTPPVIAPDDKVIDPPPDVTAFKEKAPGITDTKGDPNGITPGIVDTRTPGTGIIPRTEPKNEVLVYVEQMPEFGGDLGSYLSKNIRYPDQARENNIEGRVTLKFVVNEDGSISAAQVIRKLGGGCDEEALRVVNSMPKWKPGKQNGHPVKVYFTLPIVFKLA